MRTELLWQLRWQLPGYHCCCCWWGTAWDWGAAVWGLSWLEMLPPPLPAWDWAETEGNWARLGPPWTPGHRHQAGGFSGNDNNNDNKRYQKVEAPGSLYHGAALTKSWRMRARQIPVDNWEYLNCTISKLETVPRCLAECLLTLVSVGQVVSSKVRSAQLSGDTQLITTCSNQL